MNLDAYRLWHQCLQLVPLDQWAPDVRRDLGKAQELPFDDWWEEVGELLEEIEPALVRVIDNQAEAEKFSLWEVEGEAVLLVDLSYPTKTLMEEIERQLKSLRKMKRGKPVRESLAVYPLAKKPDIRQITLLLDVFHQREVLGKSLVETAKACRLAPHADPSDAAQRNVLSAMTSRYMRKAQALIFNAAQGSFPTY